MYDIKQCMHIACAQHISLSPACHHAASEAAPPTFGVALRVSSNHTVMTVLLFVYDHLAFSLLSWIWVITLVHGQGPKFRTISRT